VSNIILYLIVRVEKETNKTQKIYKMALESDSKKIILFISVFVILFILLGIVNKGYKNVENELSENSNTLLICIIFAIMGISIFYISDVTGYIIICAFIVVFFI
jgi:hypothetical protein